MRTAKLFMALTWLVILSIGQVYAQVNYSRVYGGNNHDFGSDLTATPDNGVLIGATSSSYSESADVLLWKIDSLGNYQWHRVYGGIWPDGVSRLKSLPDSGFIIGAYRTVSPVNGYDFWLLRTDKQGDTLWTKTFGTALWEQCTDVIPTSDKGFFMVGTTWDSELGDKDILMVKTDSLGNLLWQQVYSTDGPDTVSQALEVNGNLYLMGTAEHPDSMRNMVITVFNANGQLLWSKQYGSMQEDIGNGFCVNSQNQLMICGSAQMVPGSPFYQLYIHKLDLSGNPLWPAANHSYDNFHWNFQRIAPLSGDRSMMFGAVDLTGTYGNWDLTLGRFDGVGFPQLVTTYGSFLSEGAGGMVLHENGSISMVGSTKGFANGLDNIFYVRVDSTLVMSANPGIQVNINESNINNDKINLFPNPAAGWIYLSGVRSGDAFVIFDVLGRELKQGRFDSSAAALDLSIYPNGLYYMQIMSEQGLKVKTFHLAR
jgi:hypothetical protein